MLASLEFAHSTLSPHGASFAASRLRSSQSKIINNYDPDGQAGPAAERNLGVRSE
jgi:hypothetical protein